MGHLQKSNIIHNEVEYDNLLKAYDIKDEYRKYGSISNMIDPPTHYPCILVWYEDDSYGSTYWGEFVYLDDFEEYSNMKQSVADIYNYIKKELDNPYYDDNAYLERIKGYENVLNFIKENEK